jgi:hypothetical protein
MSPNRHVSKIAAFWSVTQFAVPYEHRDIVATGCQARAEIFTQALDAAIMTMKDSWSNYGDFQTSVFTLNMSGSLWLPVVHLNYEVFAIERSRSRINSLGSASIKPVMFGQL